MLFKQPNGKYCIAYSFDNQPITMNLTAQDIINMYIDKANNAMINAENFGKLIETRHVSDEELKKMGSDKTYAELIKYVPLRPINTRYASCDFATYGECPSCGNKVQDGIGLTHEKCNKCGQLLKWR